MEEVLGWLKDDSIAPKHNAIKCLHLWPKHDMIHIGLEIYSGVERMDKKPKIVQLQAIEGSLHLDAERILLIVYPAGDCDAIDWPHPNHAHLSSALFDCVETGEIGDYDTVLLPSGGIFTGHRE